MPEKIDMTAELEQQIQRIDETSDEFDRTDLLFVTLGDALAPLLASVQGLRVLLPEVAAKADEFYFTEDYYDGDDYEKVYEGAALCAMYVMMDFHGLANSNTFSSIHSSLNSFHNDLSDLRSYTSSWNWEYGIWAEPVMTFDSI